MILDKPLHTAQQLRLYGLKWRKNSLKHMKRRINRVKGLIMNVVLVTLVRVTGGLMMNVSGG